jgi:hypothetical protein
MSTKTTFKRVALVAVAALGFGVLSSVAPASAAFDAITPTAVTVGTIPTAAVGVVNTTPITVTAPFDAVTDTYTISVQVIASPAGSAFRGTAVMGQDGTTPASAGSTFLTPGVVAKGNNVAAVMLINTSGTPTATVAANAMVTANGLPMITTVATAVNWTSLLAQTTSAANVNITPDVAGTYTVLVSTHAGTASSGFAAGEASATYSFTTGATAASVAIAAVTGTASAASTTGQLFKVSIKDAAGVAAQLGVNETISLTSNVATTNIGSTVATTGVTSYAGPGVTLTLTSANFTNGVAFIQVKDATGTATSAVISATGSGLLSSSITGTATVVTKVTASLTTPTVGNPTGATRPGSGHVGTGTAAATVTDTASTAATSHSYLLSAATTAGADVVADINITDTSGKITGVKGATYDYALTLAGSGTTGTTAEQLIASGTIAITATLSTAGGSFIAAATGGGQVTVTSAAPAAQAPTVSPSVTVRGSVGGAVVYTATVKDQFGAALANQAITVTTAGRNAATAVSTALATDALGNASYTATDSGTAATVATTDTITFTGISAVSRSLVWSAAAVSTVTLVTGTEDDTANAVTYRDINASSKAGASTSAGTITATVKDVNGSVLVGVPVTFSTASAGAAVLSTSVTVYTGAAGTATATVYGWTAGTKTFTATAGGKSASGTANYRQGGATGTDNPSEVRTIAATASGNAITVIAKDRFGNVVSGVPLFASRTGNGLFGGGTNTASATTDVNGSAEFIFNGGTADSVVTITAGSLTSAAVAFGQTSSAAGALCVGADCVSAAFTASTVGTAVTAETGVGASLSPAGVGSVTVSMAANTAAVDTAQAAADAAAEATDAANAATDAANAAAEAADAATAAAQDAADAVAALSAQVADLISGLKAQLTALTNLVIKIQKKVKA